MGSEERDQRLVQPLGFVVGGKLIFDPVWIERDVGGCRCWWWSDAVDCVQLF